MTEAETIKEELQKKYPNSSVKLAQGDDQVAHIEQYLSENEVFDLATELVKQSGATQKQVAEMLDANYKKVSRQAINKALKSRQSSDIKIALAIIESLYPAAVQFEDNKYYKLVDLDNN